MNRDADGDIPVRCGEAVIYVRTTDQPELVSVFCPVVFGEKRSAGLFEAINDANASIRFARLAVTGPGVMASAEVDAGEGLASSLARACDAVSWVANECGSKLVDHGRTFFAEQDGSTSAEEIHGVYL